MSSPVLWSLIGMTNWTTMSIIKMELTMRLTTHRAFTLVGSPRHTSYGVTVAVKSSAVVVSRSQYCTRFERGLIKPRRDATMRFLRVPTSLANSRALASVS